MASKVVRVIINILISSLGVILCLIFILSIYLLIINIIPLVFLIFLVPMWIIIIIIEREFIWTSIFLIKKAPYKNLGETTRGHEKILKDYLSNIKTDIKKDLKNLPNK